MRSPKSFTVFVITFTISLTTWGAPAAAAVTGPTEVMTAPDARVSLNADLNFDYLGFDRGEQYLAGAGSQESDLTVRRARIGLAGKLGDDWGFNLKAGLEKKDYLLLDAYVVGYLPSGFEFRAGQMKIPFSQERLRSDTGLSFLEKSLSGSNLSMSRSAGLMLMYVPRGEPLWIYAGMFTGENRKPNTDDEFEYVVRVSLALQDLDKDVPGELDLRGSAASGVRRPTSGATDSFCGKTMNELTFFSPVPVNGRRTRYEADLEWRYESWGLIGEFITSREDRDRVDVTLDTNGDGLPDETVTRDLSPLLETGWEVSAIWVVTGEKYSESIDPARPEGALEINARYSLVSFDSQEDWIASDAAGVYGREVSPASAALGRSNIDEQVRDFYLGFKWCLQKGVYVQGAAVWQWFDHSSPYLNDPDLHSDINYRARIGLKF